MAEELPLLEPYNQKVPAFKGRRFSDFYGTAKEHKQITDEILKYLKSPGYIHSGIVNGYRIRQLVLSSPEYSIIRESKEFINLRENEGSSKIPTETPVELKDEAVDTLIDSLARLYLPEGAIAVRFANGLKKEAERNDIFRALFKRMTGLKEIQTGIHLGVPVPILLAAIGNPLFYRYLGNAIVRAQMADQYNANYKKTAPDQDDPFAVGLDQATFKEGIVIISSMGAPRSANKKEVRILGEYDEKDFEEQFLDNQELIKEIAGDCVEPNPRGEYLEAKGGKRITLTVGAYALIKKLWHSFESKIPYRTNFPFEILTSVLNLESLDQLRKGRISSLETEQSEALQMALQDLAAQLIPDIIQSAQTIIVKGEEICMINHLGQGIRLKLEYTKELGFLKVKFHLRGFFDSMSVLER